MQEMLTKTWQKVLGFLNELDKSQKTRLFITAGILVAAIVAGIIVLTRVTYVPLVATDDQKELTEMVNILEGEKIKCRVSGDDILVDKRKLSQAQALLVNRGYPKSADSIFADAFTKIKLSSTESDKRRLFIEAQGRTIAAKLKMFDYIEDASVELAIPEPPVLLFSDEELSKPTAAVMVRPKTTLTKDQVKAIVNWVAKSVENLDPNDVTVVDHNLNELTSRETDSLVEQASSQYDMKKIWREDLERSVLKIFSGQFDSFDKVTVVANPVLDFDTLKSSSKQLSNPTSEGPAELRSESRTIDLVNTGEGAAPGMATNPGTGTIPSYPMQAGGGNSTYNERYDVRDYAYNEVLTETVKATGNMVPEKSSMAINLLYGGRVQDENKINSEVEKVKEAASMATGIPVSNIAVNVFKMAEPLPVIKPTYEVIKELFDVYGPFVLIILLAAGLILAVLPWKKHREELAAEVAVETGAGAPYLATVIEAEESFPEIDLEEKSEVRKQIEKLVKQRPEAVAQLLRNWLFEDWEKG